MNHSLVILFFMLSFHAQSQCGIGFTQNNLLCNGFCNGDATATPTGASPFTFLWSTGDTTSSINSLCAGTYILTLTDGTGCVATDSIAITEPPLLIATTTWISDPSATGMCDGNISLTISGGTTPYSFQWIDCGTMAPLSPIYIPPYYNFCDGEYACVATDANGCTDTSDCVTITDPPNSIIETPGDNYLEIFPNPATDLITIQLTNSLPNIRIIFYDVAEKKTKILNANNQEIIHVPISDLKNGVYFIQIENGDFLKTEKLIIHR